MPITRPMIRALQKTDPRCKNPQPLTEEDKQALADPAEVVKALAPSREPEKKQLDAILLALVNTGKRWHFALAPRPD